MNKLREIVYRNLKRYFVFLLLINVGFSGFAQVPLPAKPQSEPILLENGTAHIGDGNVVEGAYIAFEQGKITYVGSTQPVDISKYKVIDVKGMHVYPGLILPSTIVGLEDISALRQTRDHSEVGEINPNVRALTSYNTDSQIQPTLKFNGIQIVQSTPDGSLIAGTSSIMLLDGWNWEDAAYKADDGIHLYWPQRYKEEKGRLKEDTTYRQNVRIIEKFFEDSKVCQGESHHEEANLKLEAGKTLFTGERRLYIHVDQAKEIINAILLAKKQDIKKIVLVSGTDAYYVRDFLKKNNIPVLIRNTHELPLRDYEDVKLPYKLPKLLWDEGVLVGLCVQHEMLSNSENLAYLAGTASAYGLTKEQAVQMITLNNAKILSIDDMTGTLTVGKDANIVVSKGDILDMKSNDIFKSYILGKEIELEGKQQKLYKRFRQKYVDSGYIEE